MNLHLKQNPRIDNFLNTLEWDICQWDVDLTLPSLSENIGTFFQDIFMRLLQALTETIVETGDRGYSPSSEIYN